MSKQDLPNCLIQNAKLSRINEGVCIDVRGLEAPDPLVAILSILDQPDFSEPVTVLIDREPVYLYRELAERPWNWKLCSIEMDKVTLEITRAGD